MMKQFKAGLDFYFGFTMKLREIHLWNAMHVPRRAKYLEFPLKYQFWDKTYFTYFGSPI